MATAHELALKMADRSAQYLQRQGNQDNQEAVRCINATARLMGAFNDSALTLQRLRTGGSQTVTVQHVTVANGGQAVIGNVQSGEGVPLGGGKRKMGNAMHLAAMNAAPRCGAHARTTGKPCKGPAMRRTGGAVMHGGKAGRKPTHGRYTREAIESRREVRAILRALRGLLGD